MKRLFMLLAGAMLITSMVNAQDTPPGVALSTSSEAVAFYDKGAWTAGNDTTEILSVVQKPSVTFAIEGKEVTSSSWTAYLGGFRVQPNISGLLSKTLIPKDSFTVFVDGAVGNALYSDHSAVTWLAGGGAKYALNPSGSLQWTTLTADYMRVGNSNVFKISTGLEFFFHK